MSAEALLLGVDLVGTGGTTMDDQRFDRLAKSAAEGSFRRRLKKSVLGGIGGAIIAGSAIGSAGAQEPGQFPFPGPGNDEGRSSFVERLLARAGIIRTEDGVQIRTGNVFIDTTGDEITVRTPGVTIIDGEIILS